ncbi:MAG: hypothetical protein ABI416_06195 [Ginsengibacter sp.]
MEPFVKKLVPENIKGKSTDLEHPVTRDTRDQALESFQRACNRMLIIKTWHKLTGFGSAEFLQINPEGKECTRLAEAGDYIRIDVPGPGPASGDGYDWVTVETIEGPTDPGAKNESFGMRVRACKNPNGHGNDTAHFFTGDATSTFIVNRKSNTVSVSYHGRNEVPNTRTEKLKDSVRNALVGTGALIGISEMQWSGLIKSFLEEDI